MWFLTWDDDAGFLVPAAQTTGTVSGKAKKNSMKLTIGIYIFVLVLFLVRIERMNKTTDSTDNSKTENWITDQTPLM